MGNPGGMESIISFPTRRPRYFVPFLFYLFPPKPPSIICGLARRYYPRPMGCQYFLFYLFPLATHAASMAYPVHITYATHLFHIYSHPAAQYHQLLIP
jgi:hypothetical protein